MLASARTRAPLVGLLLCFMLLAACAQEAADEAATDEEADDPSPDEEDLGTLRIAVLHSAPIAGAPWYVDGYRGFQHMAEVLREAGYTVEESLAENVGHDVGADAVRDFGAAGYDIVVAHSSGYEGAVLEVAPEYPDTWFLVFSDLSTTNDLPNVAGWRLDWSEFGYLQGAIACLATETGRFGNVNGIPIPGMMKIAGGAEQAAEDHCEDGRDAMLITWTGSLADPVTGNEGALALHGQGADVIFDTAVTAGLGMFEAASEEGFWAIGSHGDQGDLAPTVITSVIVDFEHAYEEMAQLFHEGSLEPRIYDMSVATGAVWATTPFNHPDETLEPRVAEIVEQLANGEVDIDRDHTLSP